MITMARNKSRKNPNIDKAVHELKLSSENEDDSQALRAMFRIFSNQIGRGKLFGAMREIEKELDRIEFGILR